MIEGIDEMLSKGISFSLYMTHGGTSFGHWAGANSPGFAPDVTSYDYDAPINEYGQATEKYQLLRQTLQKYADKKLPAIPKAPAKIIAVPQFQLTEFVPLLQADGREDKGRLKTFEEMDMGWGTMIYQTTLPEISVKSVLTGEFHDYAQVFVDGRLIGKIDRVKQEKSIVLPPVRKGAQLTIIVEGMGRINFGRAIKDFKGIVGEVSITAEVDRIATTWKPQQWEQKAIADDYETAVKALAKQPQAATNDMMKAGYHRGYFTLKRLGDTFLNFERWGKGQVWVNGHAMGRIWRIGPQQTLYVPACWLKKGKNEIVVLDVEGPKETIVWGQQTPELNKLQLEKSNKHNDEADKPNLSKLQAASQGQFASGNGWQTIRFSQPQRGRYLAIECQTTQKKGDRAAIAEIYLQDADGQRLSRESWSTKYANSEDEGGNHTGDKAFDLQESTYWQTEKKAHLPHLLVIDLGVEQTVSALEYLPRAEQGAPGSVKDYRIFIY